MFIHIENFYEKPKELFDIISKLDFKENLFGDEIKDFNMISQGIDQAQKLANVSMTGLADATMSGFQPQLAGYGVAQAAPIQITINAGLGTDPYALGREVNNALTKYGKVSSRVVRG